MGIVVEIDGVGRVELDDGFGALPPDRQNAVIADIVQSMKGPAAAKPFGQTLRENLFGDNDPNTQNTGELIGSALNKAGEAMTFGLIGDEAAGAADAMIGRGPDRTQFYRQQENVMRRDNPGTALAAEVAGGVLGGVALPAAAVATIPRAIASGAGVGAVYGFAEGEGNAANRATAAAQGAVGGAIGGAVAIPVSKAVGWAAQKFGAPVARLFADRRVYDPKSGITQTGRDMLASMGYSADDISEAFAREFSKQVDNAVAPQDAAKAARMAEFGIPAFRQNITGSADDFATFERARRGATGQMAEKVATTAAQGQETAMRTAADDIALGLGGGKPADQFDAAVAVSERLRGIATADKAAAQAMYRAADDAGVTIPADIAKGVVQRIQTRLADEEIDATLGVFNETRAFVNRLGARGAGDAPVSLRLVDGLRKDLNGALRTAQGEDKRALSIIKDEYDTWMDTVVSTRMFDGDEAGIDALKEARSLWSTYATKFMGKDGGSKFMQAMIDDDASPDEVTRWLFSAGRLGTGKMNSSLAKTLKDTLGDTSEEWAMVRQAAFRQMTQKPEGTTQWGPQKISENILNFVNGPGTRDLARTMYSPAELAQMRRYAGALKQMVAPPGAVNNSGTAYEMARMAQGAMRALSGAIGTGAGGPVAGAAAANAAGALQSTRGWLQARAMIKGAQKVQPRRVGAIGGATLGAGLTTQTFQPQPQ